MWKTGLNIRKEKVSWPVHLLSLVGSRVNKSSYWIENHTQPKQRTSTKHLTPSDTKSSGWSQPNLT